MQDMKIKSPWAWVPTLYFAEGIPYFLVNVVSVTMFKRLGMGNAELAMATSLLYLPWVIKPLWSPFVDIVKTKRWWILSMQALCAAAFALLSVTVLSYRGESPLFVPAMALFYLAAFASASHDIAADGFYMIGLDTHRQSVFVGIRSTFYRIASVFGQGVIVVLAGVLETSLGDIPKAWSVTLLSSSAILAALAVWHSFSLPRCETCAAERTGASFAGVFASFFTKKGVWLAMAFMLLYRLPEALSVKMLTPFMLDSADAGGLALATAQSGLVYGTVGVIALTAGGILGGLFAAKVGLRKALWPMALSLALPCSVYLFMSVAHPSLPVIYGCVALDQFGYGFGFTAYMLYMMYFSEGEYKTAHYALCTAFMALSMMIPGMFAGMLQEAVGYTGFFVFVMLCCVVTIIVTALLPSRIDASYGKK